MRIVEGVDARSCEPAWQPGSRRAARRSAPTNAAIRYSLALSTFHHQFLEKTRALPHIYTSENLLESNAVGAVSIDPFICRRRVR